VRTEDKELEGPDLEREAGLEEEVAAQHAHEEEEELPEIGSGEELRDVELDHRSRLFDALRLILAEEKVEVGLLYLPQRETHALEALQAAVTGQDHLGEFVFAEDRRALLEQALAVLQQNVTHGEPEQIAELHAKFDEMSEQIAELRDRLTSLEDAQDELIAEGTEKKAETGDEGDEDEKGGGGGDGDGEPVSTLSGTERPEAPRPASTLSGPEVPVEPARPSTLGGADRPEAPKLASTLGGADRSEDPTAPSTLYGEAPPEAPRPTSTLGADEGGEGDGDAPADPKKPWWRRPFG
jgi:hypothetical protein